LPPDEADGDEVEFCGIDVDLCEPGRGLDLLRRELTRLKAPAGTALLYTVDGHEYEEPVYRLPV